MVKYFSKKRVTWGDRETGYKAADSIANQLPWMEYDAKSKSFLLQDGASVAALFELEDVSTEAKPDDFMQDIRERFQVLFQNSIPQESQSPWHVQMYVQDEASLDDHMAHLKDYIKEGARGSQFSEEFLKIYQEHCTIMCKKGGVFKDHMVTGNVFQGKKRKIHLVIYRLIDKDTKLRRGQDALSNLNQVASRLENQLKSSDIKVVRGTGESLYNWLVRWFNPVETKDSLGILERYPYPGDDHMPFGYDFSEQFFKKSPRSSQEEGVWYFNDKPHSLLTIQSLSVIPKIGHMTAERRQGRLRYGLFDRLPEGSIFVINIIIQHKNDTIKHIKEVHKSCAGGNIESVAAREQCEVGLKEIEFDNALFPVAMGVYVRGHDFEDFNNNIHEAETLLTNNGFQIIDPEAELAPCDAYLRFLPMAYDFRLDAKKGIRRSRYIFARQIASLLPLYGRYRGTDNPCFLRWNRGGEPLCFDPYSKKDKSANSHILYLAETGGGKSASLVFDLMSTIAVYNPRVFILEAGDSFSLFCDWAEKHGKSVNQVKLSASKPTPLNPFADALKILDKSSTKKSQDIINSLIEHLDQEGTDTDGDEERDFLGEMALSAELMITGGDPVEHDKFTRANRKVVLEALLLAAKEAQTKGKNEVIAQDVINALYTISKDIVNDEGSNSKTDRIVEMADSMSNFTTDKFTSSFFNKEGKPWPSVDITRLDMGLMKGDQYEAQLSLAVMGMLTRISHIAETSQYENRMTIVLIDESHILTKNPLTSASITQFSKMCRKLGMWLQLATQNMSDFPNQSRKMLSMIEFWIGLGTSESEIDEIKRFKQITSLEKELFLSVHKDIPNYVEGVVMSRKVKGLFRNVPPRIALCLGMTEKDEKAQRMDLMKAHGVDELGAVEIMAARMNKALLESEVEL